MERPAETRYRQLTRNLQAKRSRADQRQGWIKSLRDMKEYLTRAGFEWNELIREV